MNKDLYHAITVCAEKIHARFRDCHVEINPTPDESTFFEAAVYGVEEREIGHVTNFIQELDYQLFRPVGSLLIPMVVDAEDTRNYYSAVHASLSRARLQAALQQVMPVLTGLESNTYRMDWNVAPRPQDTGMATRDARLALAA